MKVVLSLIFSLFLLGCSRTVPPKVEYKINSHGAKSIVSSKSCSDETLRVVQAFTPKYLMTTDMNYVLGKNEQYIYTQSKWVETPATIITDELQKVLRESKIFKQVTSFKSRGKYTFVLETNVEDFMQYYSQDETKSFVKVIISLSMIDAKTDETMTSQRFQSRKSVQELNAKGGVIALQKAFNEVLNKSVLFVQKSCQ